MYLGYNTWSMPTLPLSKAVEVIEEAGFDSLEIAVAEGWPSEIIKMGRGETAALISQLNNSRLVVSGLSGNQPILVPDKQWAENRERFQLSLELAANLSGDGKLRYVATTAGDLAEWNGSDDGVEEALVDRFGQLAEDARERGALIHLEPHVGSIVRRPEMAASILKKVNSPSFRISLDISHFIVQGDDEAEVVTQLKPWLGAVEVKDQRGLDPDYEWLIPGEGTQDYPIFLRALANAGYCGSVSAEISLARQVPDDFDPIATVEQTYQSLSAAFDVAGIDRSKGKL